MLTSRALSATAVVGTRQIAEWLSRTKIAGGAQRDARAQSAVSAQPRTGGEEFISIKGVSKQFVGRHGTVQALAAVDLAIADGEFISVIGPSGCGKSTLMMLLAGLEPATTGTIQIGGKAIDGPTSDLGIVFQQDVLLEWRTALRERGAAGRDPEAEQGRGNRARPAIAGDGRARGVCLGLPLRALGRHAPARLDLPGAAARSAAPGDGRAVRRAGRVDARPAQHRSAAVLGRPPTSRFCS